MEHIESRIWTKPTTIALYIASLSLLTRLSPDLVLARATKVYFKEAISREAQSRQC